MNDSELAFGLQGRLSSVLAPSPICGYSFPPLKVHELMPIFNELKINITEDELKNPDQHKESYRRVLENLIELCTGVTKDELVQPAFSGLNALNFPELHDDSIAQLNTFRAFQRIMETSGINDFGIKDFLNPTCKRFLKQLSGIINFVKFREERLGIISDMTTERDTAVDQLNKVTKEIRNTQFQLDELKKLTVIEADSVAAVENDCRELELRVSELNHRQADIREQSTELKKVSYRLKDEVTAMQMQLEETREMHNNLLGHVVNSPERFRKQITDVADLLHIEQTELKTVERKLREMHGWKASADDASGHVTAALDAVRLLKADSDRQIATEQELEHFRARIAGRQNILSELEQNVAQLNRHASRAEDKLTDLRGQGSSHRLELQATLENLRRKIADAEDMRAKSSARAVRAEEGAVQLERQVAARRAEMEAERLDMQTCYQRMERVVMTHFSNLRAALDADTTAPENCI